MTFCCVLSILFLSSTITAQVNQKEIFLKNLISKMTLEEKLGQLNLPSSGDIVTGQAKNSNIAQKIKEGKVGGLFNVKGVDKIKELQKIAVTQSRLKIPLLFGMDVIHGYETTFPIPLGLASSWDIELIKKMAQISAKEASADGICWTFSPMVDISRDPRWGRVAECLGEDPHLASELTKAMVIGYQGNSLSDPHTILACVKHFALYGASEAGRDYNTVDMSRIRMYNEYFPPYKAAVDVGVGSVMASFNEVDGIPATGNRWLLTEVLRNHWKFKGFVVTDYTGINEMIDHGVGDLQECSALALKAGIDMDMVGEGFLTTLTKSLQEGKISMEDIDASVYRILEAKYDLGLFEDPFRYTQPMRKKEIGALEHKQAARAIAAKSMVLLKNDKQILPLSLNKTFALIGPLGNNAENMPGTWSVAAKHAEAIPLLKGIEDALKQTGSVRYARGCNLHHDPKFEERASMFGKHTYRDARTAKEMTEEALNIAKSSDVILLAMGESSEMSGESSSRTDIQIPASQKELIRELKKLGKPMVLILFTGRPLDLSEEVELCDAILNVWFPGTEAGYAIADVLFGNVNPSGKLPMTFPRSVGQIPIYYNHKNTGRPLSKEKTKNCEFEKFRSNYLDECNTPLFPFGYGLSYSNFSYSPIHISKQHMKANETIVAKVVVTNTGNFDGEEVVQLYIRDKVGSITRPVRELKAFKKIFIPKQSSREVSFEITEEMLRFYNYNLEWVSEKGEFEIFIGGNSDTQNSANFFLE